MFVPGWVVAAAIIVFFTTDTGHKIGREAVDVVLTLALGAFVGALWLLAQPIRALVWAGGFLGRPIHLLGRPATLASGEVHQASGLHKIATEVERIGSGR